MLENAPVINADHPALQKPAIDFEAGAVAQAVATLASRGMGVSAAKVAIDARAAEVRAKAKELGDAAVSAAADPSSLSVELSKATASFLSWLVSEFEG